MLLQFFFLSLAFNLKIIIKTLNFQPCYFNAIIDLNDVIKNISHFLKFIILSFNPLFSIKALI